MPALSTTGRVTAAMCSVQRGEHRRQSFVPQWENLQEEEEEEEVNTFPLERKPKQIPAVPEPAGRPSWDNALLCLTSPSTLAGHKDGPAGDGNLPPIESPTPPPTSLSNVPVS